MAVPSESVFSVLHRIFVILHSMPRKYDTSYGIVPVRVGSNGTEVLLIHQVSNHRGDSYWIMPKGHPEGAETPQQTAKRELYEETGLVPYHINDSFPIKLSYVFWFDNSHIHKTVIFYIGHIEEEAQTAIDNKEVKEARWMSFAEAKKSITHSSARKVLEQAEKFLHKQQT